MYWSFVMQELGLPVNRLHVTVLESDHEARRLWKRISGLPAYKILWTNMIISGQWANRVQLWNLVFMQFFRNESESELHALPCCSIDIGMDLECMASVFHRVPFNYHTDVFVLYDKK
ncbi:unnamed protein product [Peronospora destructor]|uniref:Alanyl-tRNA synthetase class IIc N-terminal domain-containing protein n=1 Tax=Peronospora destructor TaxID=86335 RepID=A0AAV0V4E1_9STRA|nr:unnamed protein product [Peronospora destructor]